MLFVLRVCIGRSDGLGLDELGLMSGCGSFGMLGSDGVGGVSVGMGCGVLGHFPPSVVVGEECFVLKGGRVVVISTSVSAL